MNNNIEIKFLSKSENESFARTVIAAFIAPLDPTLEEMADVKTAVSEAVTNSIVHGYASASGYVYMDCSIDGDTVTIIVKDNGKGIADIKQAMEPLFTTNTDGERSGMGFTVMETFMDTVDVESITGVGTKVTLTKQIGKNRL
ncbi:MAG: anti-sigma F factor [Clostridia bacterium]|nr:anti-sigma F factor [Clostridia bacterium]